MNELPRGTVAVHRFDSQVLRNNAPGDPTERDLHVYLPPGYDGSRPVPVVIALVGFSGTGAMMFNADPLGETLHHRLDRLIGTGACSPVIVAAPDCFNRFGGSQYINSSAIGNYEDYIVEEIVPLLRRTYATGRFGVMGKSSGGYGAVVLSMRHPDVFSAFADHSGDSNFELCYLHDVHQALERFREAGGPAQWLFRFWSVEAGRRKQMSPLNFLAMAAHYSPNPASKHLGVDFPFDLSTGVFLPEVWQRWRAWDPVNMLDAHAQALSKLRAIYIDCGRRDEFGICWGTRALVAKMRNLGLSPYYEEFEDGHMSVNYRFDVSLPLLTKALGE